MMRQAMTDKILVLGVDGMDPRLTKKYLLAGKLPNIQRYLQQGAAREDLVLLGAVPTITPPMWTTLSTGCYANVHGITGFFRKSATENLDVVEYNLDSRLSKAEPLWNVFAEAGKNTLVWHWPGSAWPPSSESSNLHVVDGAQPVFVNMGTANVDEDKLVYATAEIEKVVYKPNQANDTGAGCIINHLDLDKEAEEFALTSNLTGTQKMVNIQLSIYDGEAGGDFGKMDAVNSPLKPAEGWTIALPEGAKEFTLLFSGGLIRRLGLILKNEEGIYDHIALYKSKKDTTPFATLYHNVFTPEIVDEAIKDDVRYEVNRNMRIVEMAEDGSYLKMWVSRAMDLHNDDLWSPKWLYQEIVEHVGYPHPFSFMGGSDKKLIKDCTGANWWATGKW